MPWPLELTGYHPALPEPEKGPPNGGPFRFHGGDSPQRHPVASVPGGVQCAGEGSNAADVIFNGSGVPL